jgi:threonine/homoserine/homoserine lactone efflux protein
MPKALTICGMTVAVLIVLMFGFDLAFGMPFQKASMMMDIVFLICAAVLAYLSWSAYREQT